MPSGAFRPPREPAQSSVRERLGIAGNLVAGDVVAEQQHGIGSRALTWATMPSMRSTSIHGLQACRSAMTASITDRPRGQRGGESV